MSKVKINSGSGTNVTINKPGQPGSVTINSGTPLSATYPIEYKSVSGDQSTAIFIQAASGNVDYDYLDENDDVISSGSLSMNTNRSIDLIKADVFTSLSLTDLTTLVFINPTVANYVAFGDLLHFQDQSYAWCGRRGTTHLGGGRICTQPIDSLTRTFGTRTVISRTIGEDLRGGGTCVYNGQIYFFSSLYLTGTDEFVSLTLNVSTDLTGASWNESTILYKVGTNGGIDETAYERFNFYGKPQFITGSTWIIPWYEHNGAGTWRPNFLKSTDNLATFTTHNISQSSTFKIGETYIQHVEGDTLIALGRSSDVGKLFQNVSTDLGDTWSGWVETNLGSDELNCMAAMNISTEHGLTVVYGDRQTGNVMMSINNTVASVIADPTSYNTPFILHTVAVGDGYQPLGYPSIDRVAQYRFMITFSEELTGGGTTKLHVGDGSLNALIP